MRQAGVNERKRADIERQHLFSTSQAAEYLRLPLSTVRFYMRPDSAGNIRLKADARTLNGQLFTRTTLDAFKRWLLKNRQPRGNPQLRKGQKQD